MALDSSTGVEFQSSYSLLPKKEKESKVASRGRKEGAEMSSFTTLGSSTDLPLALAKIDTDVLSTIKIFLASGSSNGDNFFPHLKDIKNVLERVVSEAEADSYAANAHIRSIYNIVTEKLISYLPKIKQSQKAMAFLLVDILSLLSALKIDDACLTFPAVFASCLLYFKPETEWDDAYSEVVSRLCHFVLPNCLVRSEYRQSMCLTSVLMMVLEACSAPKHHLLVADTLMILKREVATDILTVITYSTPSVRCKALDLLLHYWPIPIQEFWPHSHKLTYGEWTIPHCENSTCRHSNNIATTLCLNVRCALCHKAPNTLKFYLLLCPDCDATIHSGEHTHKRLKLPIPLREIKPNCEFQRICSGKENNVNKAVVTCYDDSCTAIQNGQPIRMCNSCHSKQHKDLNDPTHIYQVGLPDPWAYDNLSSSSKMLEAISKLIESVPVVTEAPSRVGIAPRLSTPLIQKSKPMLLINMDMSRKAIWLLSYYCTPTIEVRANQQEWLVHLLALVFEWMQTYYDILQAAIVKIEEQRTSAGAAFVAAGAEGQEWVDNPIYFTEFEKMFSNYSEMTSLMDAHVLYWIRSVCDTNSACVVEALKPDIPGCAQVGKMWNKAHDQISRYKRTLTIIYRLDYFHRQGKLESFSEVFNIIMPLWMDKLVDLRSSPGKMEGLQDQIMLIFSTQNKKHEQGLRIFKFIREKFWSEDDDEKQKGLFWLQDLTRLHIPLPYLPHMFDDALKETHGHLQKVSLITHSPLSSFDQGVLETKKETKKDSTGSFSGSDVEPHLLSQSSIEQMDVTMIVNLKSCLARYILMLDIWLSQLTQFPESLPTLELSVFQSCLTKMLRKVWGSSHDHHEPTSVCYLCQGVGVWFGLATRLLELYLKMLHREGSTGEDEEINSPNRRLSTRSDRLRQLVVTSIETSASPQGTPSRENDSGYGIRGGLKAFHSANELTELSVSPPRLPPQPSPPGHKRKFAQVQSHSQFRLVSESKLPPAPRSQGEEINTTPSTYILFQLCALKLRHSNLQPSALLKVVKCLLTLVQDWRALDICDDVKTVYTDVTKLFGILWKNLDTRSSNTVRACVELLLECAEYTAMMKPPLIKKKSSSKGASNVMNLSDTGSESGSEEEENGKETTIEDELLWTTLQNALTANRWTIRFKAAGGITMILQFMRIPGSIDTEFFSVEVQASLAHGFCLFVKMLVDKNSSVCAHAKYLLTTIKESSLETMKFYLKNFFYTYPSYRDEVLSTLSLLDSALPSLSFLSVDILTNLLRIATTTTNTSKTDPSPQVEIKKKGSDVSVLAGGSATPRVSVNSIASLENDPMKQKVTERILSLLLRHVANPHVDIAESMKKEQSQRAKKAGTIKTRRSTPSSSEDQLFHIIRSTVFHDLHCSPGELRRSPVFEVFLNHMFPVLDSNLEFGQTKGLLPFVLKLLCYCAAPNQSDYVQLNLEEHLRDSNLSLKACPYSLSSVPPHLRAPWLRLFFVILYKFIHNYSEVDPGSHDQGLEMLTLTMWCLQITINTLEADGHTCTFLLSGEANKRPSLQRQLTIDTFTNSITESIADDSSNPSTPVISKTRSRDFLTPVLEDQDTATSSKSKEPEIIEPGMCSFCKKPTNEYSEEVIALAVVSVGTCCHRLPHKVSTFLVSKIIPAIARVVVPGSFSWQSTENTAEPPPGSAMAVAKHIFSSLLTQFGDRRLFLFLFGTDYGDNTQAVFSALGHGLEGNEGEGPVEGTDGESEGKLSEITIVKYFLQDAVSSVKDVHPHSIVNLSTYVEGLNEIQEGLNSSIQLTKDLLLLDNFFKKLKSNTDILRDNSAMHALLRLIVTLFKNSLEYPTHPMLGNYHTHSVLALIQSLLAIIEFALYNVYVPVGGMVELASLWYRLFQQQSHRDAEKLMKLYVSELRKALGARGFSDQCPRPDNFLGLVQVLLLEESGYLGYVDGLTTKKCFAPNLRLTSEIHSRPVITALQWDFLDVLNYLIATDVSKNAASIQVVTQLKLSLSQLVALRVQHGVGRSPPTSRLKRLVSGDPRALLPGPTSFRATVIHLLQPRWQDYIKSVHVMFWLLLGALSHNYIDGIAADMKMAGNIGGQCRLLESLNHKMDEITKGMLILTNGVIQRISSTGDGYFGYLCLPFLFSATWTVYMELYTKDSMPHILEFWQKLIGSLTHLMGGDMSEIYRTEILETLNKYAVFKIKEINLSCYPLLIPIWREVTNSVVGNILFPDCKEVETISVDEWLQDTIHELIFLEQEWQVDLSH